MSSTLPPVPHRTPVVDFQGLPSQVWADWFQKLFVRAGGSVSYTNDELGVVTADRIPAGTIATAALANSAVTAAKIADGVIAFAKLLSTDWTSSQGASGYIKIPSGIYVQWGVTSSLLSGTTNSTSFPVAFPNNCFQVFASIRDNSATGTGTTGQWGTGTYTVNNFELYNRTSVAQTFNWLAIGN